MFREVLAAAVFFAGSLGGCAAPIVAPATLTTAADDAPESRAEWVGAWVRLSGVVVTNQVPSGGYPQSDGPLGDWPRGGGLESLPAPLLELEPQGRIRAYFGEQDRSKLLTIPVGGSVTMRCKVDSFATFAKHASWVILAPCTLLPPAAPGPR